MRPRGKFELKKKPQEPVRQVPVNIGILSGDKFIEVRAVPEDSKHLVDQINKSIREINVKIEAKSQRKMKCPSAQAISAIDHFNYFSMIEFLVEKYSANFNWQTTFTTINEEESGIAKKSQKTAENHQICSICQMDFFEVPEDKKELLSKPIDMKAVIANLDKDTEDDVVSLSRCFGHHFHVGCLSNYIKSYERNYIKCPICTLIYGDYVGEMPDGIMIVDVIPSKCSGYDVPTIQISYNFPSGVKRDGTKYTGTSRMAYLPKTKEGAEACELLKIAFMRRHSFIVGTSITTGQTNCVVWGIHHKSSLSGGSTKASRFD